MKYLDIAEYVRTEAHGAPDFVIERALRESAIEFCVKTDAYRLEPEIVQIIAGIDEYDLTTPSGTELNHIIDIYRNRETLRPVSYSRVLEVQGDGTQRSKPRYYAQRDNTSFFVAPIPSDLDTFRVLYSVKPTSTSTSLPDAIAKEHQETITQGALYRLQMMPNQPFTNPGNASNNKVLYEREVGRTVRQVKYGFSGGSLKVRYREFT